MSVETVRIGVHSPGGLGGDRPVVGPSPRQSRQVRQVLGRQAWHPEDWTVSRRGTVIAKFHYTDPTGPARTQRSFAAKKVRAGPCRVCVVEFSSSPTMCADFVRVGSVWWNLAITLRIRIRLTTFDTTQVDDKVQ